MSILLPEKLTIYRIEHESEYKSLWYDIYGDWTGLVFKLSEGKAQSLPMDYDPRYFEGGKKWFCGCESLANFRQWFSLQDVKELKRMGYKLYEFEVSDYKIEPEQVLFTRESISKRLEIDV